MPSNPLHRRLAVGVLSTGVLAGVLVPLTGASAAACTSWTDKKGDATTDQSGQAVLADANLDIVSAALGTVGDSLVATITTDGLGAGSSDAGDEFQMLFSVGTVNMTMYADRFAPDGVTVETDAGIFDNQGNTTPLKRGEATYDVKTKTVTIKVKTADVVEASGGKVPVGSTLTKVAAATTNVVPFVFLPVTPYDDAPTTLTPVFGTQCSLGGAGGAAPAPAATSAASPAPAGSAQPSSSARPTSSAAPSSSARPSGTPAASGSAAPSATPSGSPAPPQPTVPVPAAGCFGFADPKGDARPSGQAPNDPDLDILSVTGRTSPTEIAGHLRIDKLAGRPSFVAFTGHRFEYQFALGDKVIVLRAEATGPGVGTVNGTTSPDLKVTAAFDVVSSQVVLSVERAGLVKALGREVPEGTFLENQTGRSSARNAGPLLSPADTATAPAEEAARGRYTVGDNTCFAPKLSVSLPAEVQTSDGSLVSVALTTSDSRTAAGQTVTARVGKGRAVSGKTDEQGTVNLRVPVTDAAGLRQLVVRSTGSAGTGELSSEMRVLVERTLLSTRSSGSGAMRTVVATLTDDDDKRRALPRQKVAFTFGGRTVTATTDSVGRATVVVPVGAAVDVAFAGRSGFLSASRLRTTAR